MYWRAVLHTATGITVNGRLDARITQKDVKFRYAVRALSINYAKEVCDTVVINTPATDLYEKLKLSMISGLKRDKLICKLKMIKTPCHRCDWILLNYSAMKMKHARMWMSTILNNNDFLSSRWRFGKLQNRSWMFWRVFDYYIDIYKS